MKEKVVSMLLIGAMGMSMLTSCGTKTDENSPSAVDSASSSNSASSAQSSSGGDYDVSKRKFNDVEITVATRHTDNVDTDAEGAYYIQKVDEFNNLDNGITVNMVNIPAENDYLDRLSTDFASGDVPNIFVEYGGSRVLSYVQSDALVDLTPYLDADPDWKARINESYWDSFDYSSYGKNGIYGIPWEIYQIVLYYNKDILDKYQITPPTSWNELMDDCATLKENGVQPFDVGEKDDFRFGHLSTALALKSYGVDVATELGDRSLSYDSDEMKEIYNMMIDAYDKGYFGDNLLGTDGMTELSLFEEGKDAFMYNGSWAARDFGASDCDLYKNNQIGVVQFPMVKEEYKDVDMGGLSSGYYVSALGASEEEIAASVYFLKYITSEDYMDGLLSTCSNTFAVKSNVESDNYVLNDVIEIMGNTKETRSDLQNYDKSSYAMNIVRQALQGIGMGNTADQIGEQIVHDLSEYE